jgi:DNA polymerase V
MTMKKKQGCQQQPISENDTLQPRYQESKCDHEGDSAALSGNGFEPELELSREVFKHPDSTLLIRAPEEIKSLGVVTGDLLVADRLVEPCDGQLVIAVIDGQQTLRWLLRCGLKTFLVSDSSLQRATAFTNAHPVEVVAVVVNTIPIIQD